MSQIFEGSTMVAQTFIPPDAAKAIVDTVTNPCPKNRFFGLPPWYEYLDLQMNDVTHRCEVQLVKDADGKVELSKNVAPIGLAVLDMLLVIAGIVSVGFVIYGGIRYVVSQGEPDNTRAAQHTIINALIGGVIAMMGVAIVSFIGNRLGG